MRPIRQATEDDADYIAARLREADLREIDAASGRDPLEVCLMGLRASPVCRVVTRHDGKPIALYGVVPWPGEQMGFPWLVGTDEVTTDTVRFLRAIKPEVKALEIYPSLRGFVHAHNTAHIEWLRWIGFTLAPAPEPFGRRGDPFIQFWKHKDV